MVKFLKYALFKLLGRDRYLRLLHTVFFLLYDFNLLKRNEDYKFNYLVKKLIHEGDYVADIGANLGYFAKIFSRLVGNNGKVICIEPVKPFFDVLSRNLKNKRNCILHNYALGTENKTIELVLPKSEGVFRTGLSHIPSDESEKQNSYIFETEMTTGSSLLKDLPRLDYIKCDIEGYELIVLKELSDVIKKYLPVLQIEIWDNNKNEVIILMTSLGYTPYTLIKNKLQKYQSNQDASGDFLFLHQKQLKLYESFISN
jgi:FkbM family methyltransferase